ncbi:hypothetical protein [Pseudomonas frederiksbergensis]|uniref:Uncharacterized protein n=1 Tax=Pseudomonas frederiksbergensis TaxID=104087 RepID=A0A0B1Z4C4_9PSED|nr:hypothetical protein [Pseudomonas frederiksbergensis]KHK64257.1 hypothetical protein JZ00_13630 [Pseudomonas frederiksbergensis]
MQMPLLDRTIRQLRARAFCHAAAEVSGYAHTPSAMAVPYRRLHPNMERDWAKQWRRAFGGTTIASGVREDFFSRFAVLESLFSNPLWRVMSESPVAGYWDQLADTIRVDDRPLDGASGKLTKCVFDRVDWSCFCIHLVLLRTRHRHFEIYRQWEAKNFVQALSWVSLQSPFVFIADAFIGPLQPLFCDMEVDFDLVRSTSWTALSRLQQENLRLLKLSSLAGWLSAQDQQLALLWWNLSPTQRYAELDRLYDCGDGKERLPDAMSNACYQAWRRKRQCWLDHPVALNGFNCGFPHEGLLYRAA